MNSWLTRWIHVGKEVEKVGMPFPKKEVKQVEQKHDHDHEHDKTNGYTNSCNC